MYNSILKTLKLEILKNLKSLSELLAFWLQVYLHYQVAKRIKIRLNQETTSQMTKIKILPNSYTITSENNKNISEVISKLFKSTYFGLNLGVRINASKQYQ